jgi:phage-related protein
MKPVTFLGDSLKIIREFPKTAKGRIGRELDRLERGMQPADFKPMPTIGRGVEELRVRDERRNAYRVIYIARFEESVYVLHAFVKTTRTTPKRDLDLAKTRLQALLGERQ